MFERECEFVKIVGIRGRFPQTMSQFRYGTKNKTVNDDDDELHTPMQWNGGSNKVNTPTSESVYEEEE